MVPQPILDARQVQVDAHQAELPAPLDELVWFNHQSLEETASITSARGKTKQLVISINTSVTLKNTNNNMTAVLHDDKCRETLSCDVHA